MEFELHGRGNTYRINGKGEFYVSGHFSPTWKIFGIASRWNGRPLPWASLKKMTKDQVIKGYMWDVDHGTRRFWGGHYMGHLPVVKLFRTK